MTRLNRPPKDARCDGRLKVQIDFLGMPTLPRCPEPATVAALRSEGSSPMWLCEEHYAKYAHTFVRRTKP